MELPQTFRDAADITLRLGYSALWIDALCIIQDDDDQADWIAEAPNMGAIFGNCVLSIAALTSDDSSVGCCYTHRLPLIHIPCDILTREGNILQLEAPLAKRSYQRSHPGNMGHSDSPTLHRRAWVVQERTLAPRTLYFSSAGIYWECNSHDESDLSKIYTRRKPLHYPFLKENLKAGAALIFQGQKPMLWHNQWWQLLETYTKCDLTFISDRWNAISGMANIFAAVSQLSLVHGMWRKELAKEMLWKVAGASGNRLSNGRPTWS
ncbi:hypothetical protein T440DRAFT_156955 [Plenodomus tracheiphilus IPT5]|uniref:Heterokaryon incompatibility domain-containing protein n=1 Tax=Plenodomus tracheiphilus IPT5 TaxID=1408161 RepID=A0A6A7BL71_9PLEO|nr:hypothetical protein T440DRAFT_156955 [Plenodomus tracheiphilus IPT5]